MFRFNPYNFTITIDEAIASRPPGTPDSYVPVFDPKQKPIPYTGPLAAKPGYRTNRLGRAVFAPAGAAPLVGANRSTRVAYTDEVSGKLTTPSFSKMAAAHSDQVQPLVQNALANVAASKEASATAPMTQEEREGRMKAFAERRAAKLARRNGGTATPPVSSPPLPPPPTGTSTEPQVSERQANFMAGAKSFSDNVSGWANSWAKQHPKRRADLYGDPGKLLFAGIKGAVGIYNRMKTPGTPGSPATATTPAVAAVPGKFDWRAGTRMARAGSGALAGAAIAGPIGALVGAGFGALTARRQPIPEERYYRVYKMISQHDHR